MAKWMSLAVHEPPKRFVTEKGTFQAGMIRELFEPVVLGGPELVRVGEVRYGLARAALRAHVPYLTGRVIVAVGLQMTEVLWPRHRRPPVGAVEWLNLNASWLTRDKVPPALALVIRAPYPAAANLKYRGRSNVMDGAPSGTIFVEALRVASTAWT